MVNKSISNSEKVHTSKFVLFLYIYANRKLSVFLAVTTHT